MREQTSNLCPAAKATTRDNGILRRFLTGVSSSLSIRSRDDGGVSHTDFKDFEVNVADGDPAFNTLTATEGSKKMVDVNCINCPNRTIVVAEEGVSDAVECPASQRMSKIFMNIVADAPGSGIELTNRVYGPEKTRTDNTGRAIRSIREWIIKRVVRDR